MAAMLTSALPMTPVFLWFADPRWNEIKKFLKSADTDGNGSLSKEEFKKGVVASCGVSEDEADAIVAWVSIIIWLVFPKSEMMTCSESFTRAGVKSTTTVQTR